MLTMQSVIYGLQFLLLEPNPDDPLNKEVSATSPVPAPAPAPSPAAARTALNKEVRASAPSRTPLPRGARAHPARAASRWGALPPPPAQSSAFGDAQAAEQLKTDRRKFATLVRQTFKGCTMSVGGARYTFPKFE